MSPEAIFEKRYSEASAVWSFGITIIECLTNSNPWEFMPEENHSYIGVLEALSKILRRGCEGEVIIVLGMLNRRNSRPLEFQFDYTKIRRSNKESLYVTVKSIEKKSNVYLFPFKHPNFQKVG